MRRDESLVYALGMINMPPGAIGGGPGAIVGDGGLADPGSFRLAGAVNGGPTRRPHRPAFRAPAGRLEQRLDADRQVADSTPRRVKDSVGDRGSRADERDFA
jgi:hypothetical protein